MPLNNGVLKAYVSSTSAGNKLHIYRDNFKPLLVRALTDNICINPYWWNTRTPKYKKLFQKGLLAGKVCQTVHHGQIKEFTVPPLI